VSLNALEIFTKEIGLEGLIVEIIHEVDNKMKEVK